MVIRGTGLQITRYLESRTLWACSRSVRQLGCLIVAGLVLTGMAPRCGVAQGFDVDDAIELWMLDPRIVSDDELQAALADITSTTLHAGSSDIQGVTGDITLRIYNSGSPASGGLLPGVDRSGQLVRLWTPNTITRIGGSGGAVQAQSGYHLFHAGTNVTIDAWTSSSEGESVFNWRINSVSSDATPIPTSQPTPQPTVHIDATPPLHSAPGSATNSVVLWLDSPTPTPTSTWWVERMLIDSTVIPFPSVDFVSGANVIFIVTDNQVEIAAQSGATPGPQPTPLNLQAVGTPPIQATVHDGNRVVVWMEDTPVPTDTPTFTATPSPTLTPTWIVHDVGNVTASIVASASNASVTLNIEVGTPLPIPTAQEFRANGGVLLQGRPVNFIQGSSIVIEATDDGTNLNVIVSAMDIAGATPPTPVPTASPIPTRRIVIEGHVIPGTLEIEDGLGLTWSYDGADGIVQVSLNTPTVTPTPTDTPTMHATAVAVDTFGPLSGFTNVQDGLEELHDTIAFTPVPVGNHIDAYLCSEATGNALVVSVTTPLLHELPDVDPEMTPVEGYVLGYNGGIWGASELAVSSGGGASKLDELLDVRIAPTPVAGEFLVYSGTGEWNVGGIVTSGSITATYEISSTSRVIRLDVPTPVPTATEKPAPTAQPALSYDDDQLVSIGDTDYTTHAIVIGNPTPGATPLATPYVLFDSRDNVREKNLVFHDTVGGADTGAFYQNNTASSGDLELDVRYGFGVFLSQQIEDSGGDEGYHTFDVFHYDSGSSRDIQRIKAGKTLSFIGPVSMFPAPTAHPAPTPVNFGPQRFQLDHSSLALGTGDRSGQTPPASGDDFTLKLFDQMFVHHEENDGNVLVDKTVNYVRLTNGHIEILEGIAIPERTPEYDPPANTSFVYISPGDTTPSILIQNAAGDIWGVSMTYIGQAP